MELSTESEINYNKILSIKLNNCINKFQNFIQSTYEIVPEEKRTIKKLINCKNKATVANKALEQFVKELEIQAGKNNFPLT